MRPKNFLSNFIYNFFVQFFLFFLSFYYFFFSLSFTNFYFHFCSQFFFFDLALYSANLLYIPSFNPFSIATRRRAVNVWGGGICSSFAQIILRRYLLINIYMYVWIYKCVFILKRTHEVLGASVEAICYSIP